MCGIRPCRVTDGILVRIAVVSIHELTVDVELQVVIQQRRIQRHTRRCPLEVTRLQNTVLVRVAHTHAVRHILQATLHGHAVVRTHSRMEYLRLPVSVAEVQQAGSLRVLSVIADNEFPVRVTVQHVQPLFLHAQAHVAVIAHLRSHARPSLLRRDDDHTVTATAAIDGRSRGVLQHGEALDIVRVHHRERVRSTLDTLVVHRQAVDHDQRVVRGVQRRTATNTDSSTTTRSTATVGHVHTGNLTLHHVLCACNHTVVLLVRLQRRHRTRQVVFTGNTITNDNNLVQQRCVILKKNLQVSSSLNRCRLIADVADRDVSTRVSFQHEVTVEVGHRGVLCAVHAYRCADNCFACSIFHMAFDLNLSKGTHG